MQSFGSLFDFFLVCVGDVNGGDGKMHSSKYLKAKPV